MATKQTNIVVNYGRQLLFFEGEELAFNYQTGQWSRVPAYDGFGMFSVFDKSYDIGLVVYSSGSVDLQEQQVSSPAQTATMATGATDANQFGRTVVNGVRPIINGGTVTVQAGVQDSVTDSASWCAAVSPNARTGYGNMRCEGRYVRVQVTVTGGFNTLIGADVEFTPQGRV